MFRNKIMVYFLNKSQKCFEELDFKGWRRNFMIAWRFTDAETREIVRPMILEHLDTMADALQSKLEGSMPEA